MGEPVTENIPQPKARILELYGAFGRRVGGWMAIADIITLLADFGIEETAIRSACSRMKANGLLVSEKREDSAGYRLSEEAVQILADGDGRIFRAADDGDPDSGWVLCVFSVPETERNERYLIRSRLTWLGFGQASPGVWIAPRTLRPEAERMLQRLDVTRHVTVWEGTYRGFAEETELVSTAWDLAPLREVYDRYIAEFEPTLERWNSSDSNAPRKAFIEYLESLSHWRRLPYLDPGLPQRLTPDDWPAHRARALFNGIEARLEEKAFQHFLSVVAG